MHPQHNPAPARRRRGFRSACVGVSLAALGGLSLAACGKDSATASAASPSTAPTAPSPSTGDTSTEAAAAACTPYLSISQTMNEEQPDTTALPPLLSALTAAAPAELKDSLAVMVDSVNKLIATKGQEEGTETREFAKAQTNVSNWMFDNCSFDAKVTVTTKDFEFDGLPATMKPGLTAFLVTNVGPEAHEMTLNKKKADTTESWQDLLKLPEDQAKAKVVGEGGAFVPAVGDTALLVVDLTPGDYAAMCFVPMGSSTSSDGTVTQGTGAPHVMSGMIKELTVAA